MGFDEIAKLVLDSSVTVIVIAYFMYRDIKFMTGLTQTLQALVDTINNLKEKGEE